MSILDSPLGNAGWRRVIVSIWTMLECLLLTGPYYGWNTLVIVFKEEGIYGDLCEDNWNTTLPESFISSNVTQSDPNRECWLQDDRFALCFTIASFSMTGFTWVTGTIHYKAGTRIARLFICLLNVTGALCLAFVSKDVPWLMYPGMALIAVGGLSLLITNVQVANVFTKFRSTFVGLLCGLMDSSSIVFLFVKIAYQHSISRRTSFFILTALYLFTLVSTFLFHAKTVTNPKLPPSDGHSKDKDAPVHHDASTFTKVMKQPLFITFSVWLALLQLRFFYIMGTMNVYLSALLNNDNDKVNYYTDVFYYSLLFGVVAAILPGALFDWLKRSVNSGHSQQYRNLVPAIVPMACASVLSVLASAIILVEYEPLLYVLFIVITLMRPFIFAMVQVFILAAYPAHMFGAINGIVYMVSALFASLQYAFFTWTGAYESGRFHADVCLLFLSLVTLCHPLCIWISTAKERTRVGNQSRLADKQGGMKYTDESIAGASTCIIANTAYPKHQRIQPQ